MSIKDTRYVNTAAQTSAVNEFWYLAPLIKTEEIQISHKTHIHSAITGEPAFTSIKKLKIIPDKTTAPRSMSPNVNIIRLNFVRLYVTGIPISKLFLALLLQMIQSYSSAAQ